MTETGCLNTACATKMLMPNGGVKHPMLRFAVMMIPKWIGSMPAALMMGRRIGVSSRIAEAVSMKQPTISRNALMTSSSVQGGRSKAAKAVVSDGPTPLVVSSQENTPAEATTIMICDVM